VDSDVAVRRNLDHGLSYVIRLASGKVLLFEVHAIGPDLRVDTTELLTPDEQNDLRSTIAWMLCLDHDFSEFYALASTEPKLSKMIERKAGRVLRSPTLFEDVIRTLLTTNTLWKHTLRMCHELTTHYGEPLPDPDHTPSPLQIGSPRKNPPCASNAAWATALPT
jgi:hypothetical protein